jgi:poly-beta-1,6-N-acetyl-D-glucosamine synthase
MSSDESLQTAEPSRRYCLISPCRDEQAFARTTLESVVKQSILPALWVIVDDGSTDETPQILAEYAEKYPFIRVVTRTDRGDRKLGGGVIDAFYAGYETIVPEEFDYLCKFDLDLDLPLKYFQVLMEKMESDPRIGTSSGKAYFYGEDGRLMSEKFGDENSMGPAKFYRVSCFKEIGGFVRELMWDGIDGHRCRMLGWEAVSWDEPDIRVIHLRPMGTSHINWWVGRMRWGFGQYFMGTHVFYLLASAVYRMTRPPLIVGGLAIFWGYLKAMLQGKPRYDDLEFRRFLQRYQWACLLKGKGRATADLNRQQLAVWNARVGK